MVLLHREASTATTEEEPEALLEEVNAVAVRYYTVVDAGVLLLDGSATEL